jgi:ketosteroid isomerase-like protein
MSQENVELVRSIYAAWERGDFSRAEWADPEIELVIPDGTDRGTRKGVAEMAQAWRDFLSAWEDYRVEAEEYRELDGDRVLVLMRHGGRGKTSGIDVEQLARRGMNLFHIRDGKVVSLTLYWDRDRTLADLGLAE